MPLIQWMVAMDGSVRLVMIGVVSTITLAAGCFSAGEVGSEAGISGRIDAADRADGVGSDAISNVDGSLDSGCSTIDVGTEVCDGVDNDCDGEVDESDAADARTWYADADGDGYGDPDEFVDACSQPDGYVTNADDCDDTLSKTHPRQFFPDQDGDGYTAAMAETVCSGKQPPEGYAVSKSSLIDCNDSNNKIRPGRSEVCDGKDTDCDGTVDNIDQESSEGTMWFVDCDDDGYSPDQADKLRACQKPPQSDLKDHCSSSSADWTDTDPADPEQDDCNDFNSDVYPDQNKWFVRPAGIAGSNIDKWDYDCDGKINQRYTRATSCDGTGSGPKCHGNELLVFGGWVGPSENPDVPCGETAPYHGCHDMTCSVGNSTYWCPKCNSSATMKTQGCH